MTAIKFISLSSAAACAALLASCGGGSEGSVNSTARQACESIGGTNVPGVGYVFATPVSAEGAVPKPGSAMTSRCAPPRFTVPRKTLI